MITLLKHTGASALGDYTFKKWLIPVKHYTSIRLMVAVYHYCCMNNIRLCLAATSRETIYATSKEDNVHITNIKEIFDSIYYTMSVLELKARFAEYLTTVIGVTEANDLIEWLSDSESHGIEEYAWSLSKCFEYCETVSYDDYI